MIMSSIFYAEEDQSVRKYTVLFTIPKRKQNPSGQFSREQMP